MPPAEPILVLTTGGTIDKSYFDALSAHQIGESMVGRLLAVGRVEQPFTVRELLRKDSLKLTDDDRALIVATVRDAPERLGVITHGTDTMSTTAAALAGVAGKTPEKTIVLVGALAPARFAGSAAPFNLGMAFACAQTAAPGLWITMNGTVFPAQGVVKDRTRNAFVWSGQREM